MNAMIRQAFFLLLTTCIATAAQTNTYYVNVQNGGNSAAPYTSWATAATNIQDAVAQAEADIDPDGGIFCDVVVEDGVYVLTNQIILTKGIDFHSLNGPDSVTIDGGFPANTNRCLMITNCSATVRGFTITNGFAYGPADLDRMGGGILATEASGIIENCRIRFNRSNYAENGGGYGGGMAIHKGTPIVRDCVIDGNSTVESGSAVQLGTGLYITDSAAFVYNCVISNNVQEGDNGTGAGLMMRASYSGIVSNCLFTGNSSSRQGGNYVFGGILTHCVFSNNYARSTAGGLYVYGTTTGSRLYYSTIVHNRSGGAGGGVGINRGIVENCIIMYNRAKSGGGINNSQGTIKNCLIAANYATGSGGGIARDNNSHTIRNCTITRNEAAGSGGGVYNQSVTDNNFLNSIIYNNKASVSNDYWGPANAIGYSCAPELTDGINGNLAGNPLFRNPGSGYGLDATPGDWRLRPSSPCRNSGLNESWMLSSVDVRGYPRIIPEEDGIVDMGAYENIPVPMGTLFIVH